MAKSKWKKKLNSCFPTRTKVIILLSRFFKQDINATNIMGPIIYFIEDRSPSRHKWGFCIYHFSFFYITLKCLLFCSHLPFLYKFSVLFLILLFFNSVLSNDLFCCCWFCRFEAAIIVFAI